MSDEDSIREKYERGSMDAIEILIDWDRMLAGEDEPELEQERRLS